MPEFRIETICSDICDLVVRLEQADEQTRHEAVSQILLAFTCTLADIVTSLSRVNTVLASAMTTPAETLCGYLETAWRLLEKQERQQKEVTSTEETEA